MSPALPGRFFTIIKRTNLHLIEIPEGEDREKGTENKFEEIMTENFPNLEKEMEAQSHILAWEIPWTEEPGGLQSMGSQRVGRN